MGTHRFMCLGCGKYWATGERPVRMCPYCADAYYADNIIEDVPPLLGNVRVDFGCGHCMSSDIGDEVKYCPACGNEEKTYASPGPYGTLEQYQDKVLKELGL